MALITRIVLFPCSLVETVFRDVKWTLKLELLIVESIPSVYRHSVSAEDSPLAPRGLREDGLWITIMSADVVTESHAADQT